MRLKNISIIKCLFVISEENGVPVPHLWESAGRSYETKAGDLQQTSKHVRLDVFFANHPQPSVIFRRKVFAYPGN